MWVRFPSPALCASGSVGGARPCQGRGRGFESRLALSKKHKKMVSDWIPSFLCFRAPPGLEGSRSPLRSGRCKANIHRMFCNVSRSNKQGIRFGHHFVFLIPPGLEGSRSPLRSGRCKANIHRMFCNVSRSNKQGDTVWTPFCFSNPVGVRRFEVFVLLRSLQSECLAL